MARWLSTKDVRVLPSRRDVERAYGGRMRSPAPAVDVGTAAPRTAWRRKAESARAGSSASIAQERGDAASTNAGEDRSGLSEIRIVPVAVRHPRIRPSRAPTTDRPEKAGRGPTKDAPGGNTALRSEKARKKLHLLGEAGETVTGRHTGGAGPEPAMPLTATSKGSLQAECRNPAASALEPPLPDLQHQRTRAKASVTAGRRGGSRRRSRLPNITKVKGP